MSALARPAPPGSFAAGRSLRCEGAGPLRRGCFNWVDLGTLTEIQFRVAFGAVLCAGCYIHGWYRAPHPPLSAEKAPGGAEGKR